MEKQYSLDLEQAKLEKISTFMDGQSQLPATQHPKTCNLHPCVIEPDAYAFFLSIGDELTLHIDMDLDEPVTIERMRRYYRCFLDLVVLLEHRGMTTIKTWIEDGNENQRKLARFFGFWETGVDKLVTLVNGDKYYLEEMEFTSRGN